MRADEKDNYERQELQHPSQEISVRADTTCDEVESGKERKGREEIVGKGREKVWIWASSCTSLDLTPEEQRGDRHDALAPNRMQIVKLGMLPALRVCVAFASRPRQS